MNFQIGEECLCIKTHSGRRRNGTIGEPSYIKGKTYPVLGLIKGCSHTPLLIDIGVISQTGSTHCGICKHTIKGNYWDAENFAPIDNTLSDTTVEDLLEEPVKEKL